LNSPQPVSEAMPEGVNYTPLGLSHLLIAADAELALVPLGDVYLGKA